MKGRTSSEPMRACEVVRVRTTGGGWRHPLDRAEAVLRDVVEGTVSREAAGRDYGVVIATVEDPTRRNPPVAYPVVSGGEDAFEVVDDQKTADLWRRLRDERDRPFFDRGPRYARLADGASHADVDELSPGERTALDAAGSGRRLTS